MKRDDQPGSICWASIAGEALVPGEPPMRALCSGHNLLGGARAAWGREWSGAFQAEVQPLSMVDNSSPFLLLAWLPFSI
jgi:hypothetical protein